MQREIKFRGFSKRFRPNEWFYGDLVNYRSEKYILPEGQDVWDIIGDGVEVHSESVGQFTGLKDKNGKEIYEGDILKSSPYSIGAVLFRNGVFLSEENRDGEPFYYPAFHFSISEIIGNIYENPELLKNEAT